jgi:microcystin degradation protein MlrC
MQIAVGGIYHESNTFFSQPMTVERFAECQLHYGEEILGKWRNSSSEMGGFLAGADRHKFSVSPTLMAWGMPAGEVTDETFETLVGDLVQRLKDIDRLDGVLLSLHGAMVSNNYSDADGEILRRVREAIGSDKPLVATVDFHANLTEEMVRWPNAIVGYDTYPHVDQVERGLEAAGILYRILEKGLQPTMALARRPLLPHILSQTTDRAPMAQVIEAAHKYERKPGLVSITVCAGFPYTDVPKAGFAVLAVGEDAAATRAAAESLADEVWKRRTQFAREITQPAEAVREAIAFPAGPALLVDVGDNVGAGTPGDGTVLLSELLAQGAQNALVLLCDPEAVAECIRLGIREQVKLNVGGKHDRHHGPPVEVTGQVRLLADGIYRNTGPMRDGVWEDQGKTAVVDTGGVIVVLTERRAPMWNLQQLRALGIEPTRLRIIVLKSAIAYRAAYAPIAKKIIDVDTPGLAAADVRRFHYRKLERPIYPLDPL